MSELRPYQVTAIDSALAALSNSGSAVMQMPTGAGKTRAATEIVGHWEGVVWFICHRVEIAQQTAKAFKAAGIEFGMISPRAVDPDTDKPYPLEPNKRVQIITIGTLPRLLADLPAPSLVVWDECHHVAAKSWAKIREMLTDAKHLGLTATPERLDGKGLSKWFAELVVGPTIESLIADEWLSPFRYFAPSDPDLSAAKIQAGDYNKKDLAKVMNTPVLIGDAVAEYRRVADGKRAIAFCASKEASRALVERFNAEGVPALHVDGNTHSIARREAVRALAAGDIKVLSNVEVFTEGFDVPGIEAVILMRPTKSPTLLLQMIGRALRFVEGKTSVIMDHAGLWQDHGNFARYESWSIHGGAVAARRRSGVGGLRCCPECKNVPFERVPVCENCGFEFPSGREVGEYDGVLREVVDSVPEGHETQSAFAARIGLPPNAIIKFRKEGLPYQQVGMKITIPIIEGLTWIVRNSISFRRRMPINNYKGIQINTNGWVSVAQAAELTGGRSSATIYGWIRSGELKSVNGLVDPVEARMISKQKVRGRPLPQRPDGYETFSEFARRYNRDASFVRSLVPRGLPVSGPYVEVGPAVIWVESNVRFRASTGSAAVAQVDLGCEYENIASFARRIGKSGPTVAYWRRRNFPFHPEHKTMIHIQRGLEWVRDNTSIQIPPEAWPSANDNAAAADSAAA